MDLPNTWRNRGLTSLPFLVEGEQEEEYDELTLCHNKAYNLLKVMRTAPAAQESFFFIATAFLSLTHTW